MTFCENVLYCIVRITGANLIRLLQHEAQRLKLPIRLMAIGDKKKVHKLYEFYEQLGFVSVPDTVKLYDNAKSESQDFRIGV